MVIASVLQYLVFVSAGAFLAAAYVYVKAMLKGGVKPNRVSWLLWAIASMISFAAAISDGAGLAAVPVFMSGFCPLLIFAASFVVKGAYWKLAKLDYACGLMSALAIFLWVGTSDPDIAILFAILSDTLASVPTLVKGWRYPKTESAWTYLVGVFGGLTGLLAVTAWTFSQYAFPTYLVIMSVLLVLSICYKRILTYF